MVKKCPGVGHLPIQWVLHVGHLNSFLELGDGNLTAKFGCPRGRAMLKLQIIDTCRCIIPNNQIKAEKSFL